MLDIYSPNRKARHMINIKKIILAFIFLNTVCANIVDASVEKKPLVVIKEVVSPKGIKAWLVEDHSIPVVSMSLSFDGGGLLDPQGKEGLSEIMAQMMTEGAGPYTQESYFSFVEDHAIQLSFDSSDDVFSINLRTTKDNLDRSVKLFKTTLYDTHFKVANLKKVKDTYLVQLDNLLKDPSFIAGETMDKILFKDHPYARSHVGTKQTITSIQQKDLFQQRNKQFKKNYLKIGVCGDITEDDLKSRLDELFGDLEQENLLQSISSVSLPETPANKTIRNNRPQSTVLFAQKSIPSNDVDYIKVMILNKALGDGFGSRLMKSMRVDGGLVYSVSTDSITKEYANVYLGRFASDNKNVEKSIQMVKDQLRLIRDKGITKKELESAKDALKGGYVLRFNSSLNIASIALAYQRLGLPIDYPDLREEKIDAVSLEDVNRFAKNFFKPDHLIFVVVGNPQ